MAVTKKKTALSSEKKADPSLEKKVTASQEKNAAVPQEKKAPEKKTAASLDSKPRNDEALLELKIRERAYQLWEEDGRPQGYHVEHWLKAKSEILGH
jgi:hypothetical protein